MAWWKRALGLKTVSPEWYADPSRHASGPIELTYLGTAGFVIESSDRALVLDPFVTRSNLWHTVTRPLVPDPELIRRVIPRADDVVIGHSHFDHILDAPDLCRQTGARLIGSPDTMMVGRAVGLPEAQMVATKGREDIASGSWTVRGFPSRHGKVFGRIPLPGNITVPPPWPARMRDLPHGLVLNWLVDTGGLRIMHVDSADYICEELRGLKVDVVCLCAVGRQYRPNYVKEIVELLEPRWIVPCHWDTMMTPIDAEPDLIPGVDLPGFLDEIREAGCEPLLMPILGRLRLPASRDGA